MVGWWLNRGQIELDGSAVLFGMWIGVSWSCILSNGTCDSKNFSFCAIFHFVSTGCTFWQMSFEFLLMLSSDCVDRIISPCNIVPVASLGQIAGPCCYQQGSQFECVERVKLTSLYCVFICCVSCTSSCVKSMYDLIACVHSFSWRVGVQSFHVVVCNLTSL